MANHDSIGLMQRLDSGRVEVGDYITTEKRDRWWKVEGISEERDGSRLIARRFAVVNSGGYRKEISDFTGSGRRFYRWIAALSPERQAPDVTTGSGHPDNAGTPVQRR